MTTGIRDEAAFQGGTDNLTLRLEHVSRHFGKVRAVDDLSLEVPQHTFVTLLGPSGCGKSTTLSVIAGLDQLDAGKVFLGDRDITNEPPNERRMAMVFQNYALYPHMTAFDNIAFGLKLQRRPKPEIRQRVTAIAETLDIAHLMKRKPGQLSGGQQQRVALGRALVKEPVVFLLDEPFSNLDAGLRARMRSELKRLHLRLETTSVFVTHDQEEAMTLSDLIAVMRDGQVVQYASPREIYRKPQDLYVATFVGKPSMSLVAGALEHREGSLDLVARDLRIRLGPAAEILARDGTWHDVTAGFRAEDVRLVGETRPDQLFRGVVQLVEPIGSDTFVEVEVGESTIVARVPPTRASRSARSSTWRLPRGESIFSSEPEGAGSAASRAAPAPEVTVAHDNRRVAAAALLVSALSIATSSVLVRRAYDFGSSPETVVVLRVAVPGLAFVLWVAAAAVRSRSLPRLGRNLLFFAALYGLLLLVINLFELKALDRMPVALVILIIALVPLWISLASWILWHVPLGRRGALAVVVAIAGTALVVGAPSGRVDALGIVFSLVTSVLSAALYLLVERRLSEPPPQVVIAIGAAVAAVVAIGVEPHALPDELGSGGERALLVLGAGLGVSLTMLLSLIGIRHSSAFVAGIAVACEPIFAGVLAWWILDETLSALQVAGGAIALVGLGIALAAPAFPRVPLVG